MYSLYVVKPTTLLRLQRFIVGFTCSFWKIYYIVGFGIFVILKNLLRCTSSCHYNSGMSISIGIVLIINLTK